MKSTETSFRGIEKASHMLRSMESLTVALDHRKGQLWAAERWSHSSALKGRKDVHPVAVLDT